MPKFLDVTNKAAARTALGVTELTVEAAPALSYDIDPTPLTASDVGAYTRAEVDEAIDSGKRGPVLTGIRETVHSIYDVAGFELDPMNGGIQISYLGANRTPKATYFTGGQSITLMVAPTSYTITWTDGTLSPVWVGGAAPALSSTQATIIVLWKPTTTIYAALVGYA